MAATRLRTLYGAFLFLAFYSAGFVQSASIPNLDEIVTAYYTTEVQVTDAVEEASAYATEYYSGPDKQGSVKIFFQGDMRAVYYDNTASKIAEVVDYNCTVTDSDISDYDYFPIYQGWLNRDPLVIGPSAALWYAQKQKDLIKEAGTEVIRNIKCDKFTLPVVNKRDNLTIQYYFSPDSWTTPYQHEKLRTPIRIRISGTSSRYSANPSIYVPVDIINDFAYFRPTVIDLNDLIPPIGLGCKGLKETDEFPDIPDVFQYSAEVVNLLTATEHDDVEIQFQKTWYDHTRQLARLDRFTRKKGYRSNLYDFNTGTVYKTLDDGSCKMAILRDQEFQVYDYGLSSRMMEPKEALNLDGTFYDMGKREIRGLRCDAYESVKFDEYFNKIKYYKVVTTIYFTETATNVGVSGETESRIPVYMIVNCYSTPTNKTLQLQYNMFEFDDVIWPEMYSSFKLEKCYTKAETKVYFVLILEVPAKIAATMEDQDELITRELRNQISKHAKVPDMRIPFLKVDYKPTGVYATGVILERPPALLQFYKMDSGPTVTHDPDLKIVLARNTEQCSYACVDEGDFLCKGFYFCNEACFLKSTDPFDVEESEAKDLGECTEYIRAEIESTNFRQAYLVDALENLETAVLNKSIAVEFQIPGGEEIVKVMDVVIGEGPYTGVDTGDKEYTLSVEMRKLDASIDTTNRVDYVGTLHECYKQCKEAGSLCSSFSFCTESSINKDDMECLISSELVIKGKTPDTDLQPGKSCNVYNLKFVDYFIAYPEKVSLLPGDKVVKFIETVDECAKNCLKEQDFKCRGFEYCRSAKTCTLHKKHILDLKPGESGSAIAGRKCTHYAARYFADYMDMGGILIDDKTDVRSDIGLEECAKICSEELREDCKSFNFCPDEFLVTQGTCTLTSKLLKDEGVPIEENWKCNHYEKRDNVHDWDNAKAKSLAATGYTKKGFAGLVVGMLALGLIIGALVFVLYSYMKSRSSGEGMAVRFMRNET